MDWEREPELDAGEGTVSLQEAKSLLRAMAHRQSLLLLSPPGAGKSAIVMEAAREAGLPCRSLLGTQIAPEDVSGIPRIIGERVVFCPPRVLLPENPEPFCLFLDELPATPPDVQKAFYSLLLERRIGEYRLPEGSWVVGAGNRMEDRALVRAMSSALINRVTLLHIHVDTTEWLTWAKGNGVRPDILDFIAFRPEALMRPVPATPVPFSTPRSWTALSEALDLAERAGVLTTRTRRAIAGGAVSAEDAALFCSMAEQQIRNLRPLEDYLQAPSLLPEDDIALWFVLHSLRGAIQYQRDRFRNLPPAAINAFLCALSPEHRSALLVDLVEEWGALGAEEAFWKTLHEATGL